MDLFRVRQKYTQSRHVNKHAKDQDKSDILKLNYSANIKLE
jgi:hypothetical protein